MAVSAASRPGLQRPARAFAVTSVDNAIAIFVGAQQDHPLACFIKTLKQEASAGRAAPCRDQVRPHSSLGYKPPAPEAAPEPLSATAS